MADPITPNVNILQVQSDANRQQLLDRIEIKQENERVKNFAETHKEKMKQETDKISEEMGHDAKIIRHEEPVNRFPEDEKTEQRLEDEKKESVERRIKGMDGNYLKELERDLKNCRSVYATVEYNDGKELAEIRKRLGSKDVEETIAIKSSRDQYQKTLDRFKDAKIEELKEKDLSGEPLIREMTELIKQFGFMETLEMSNARSDAKAESNMGLGLAKKCWGLMEKTANAYNKLPLWKKLGISVGTIALGTAGAVGLVGAKRVLSGVVAGVGVAKGLDALHQAKMDRAAKKDIEKVFEEMDKVTFNGTAEENIEERYAFMRAALDTKLASIDQHLKNQKMVSLCNKFIGISAGVFLGSGMAAKAFGEVSGKVVEHFQHGEHAANIAKGALAGTMEHPANAPTETVVIRTPGKDIHGHIKHDSFIKNLRDHIKNVHKDIDHPGEAAETIFHDAAKNYALEHKMSYAEAVKKLSNIHPGTTYTITQDSYGMHMHIDDEHVKFVKEAGHGHHSVGTHGHGIKSSVEKSVLPAETTPIAPEDNSAVYQRWNQDIVAAEKAEIVAQNEKYSIAGSIMNGETPYLDSSSPNYQSNLEYAQMLTKGADDFKWAPAYEVGRIGGAIKHANEHMQSLLNMPDKETFTKIGKDFFDSKSSNISKFGNMNVREALSDPDNKLQGLSEKAKKLIIGYASSDATKPKVGENFKVWSYRIMTLTRKS